MKAWLVAARPRTLLASVAPVLVGTGVAAGDGVARVDAFAVTLLAAVLLNVAVNFANDASDHARGTDTAERIGPPRAVASGLLTARQVWTGTVIAFAAAAGAGAYLWWISGWLVPVIGVTAILAALAYTGGPWPYGYHGLGEVFVFLYFGVAAVVGSRYVHDATITLEAALLSVPVGFLAAAILVANNVRDIETDRASKKHTLAVILGRRGARRLFATLVVGAFAVVALLVGLRLTAPVTLLALAAAPIAFLPVRLVTTQTAGPPLVHALGATARLHLVFGALLGLGASLG